MKVLAIGNSFSQDATRYLRQIAKSDGFDMKVVNLYIGGCPLRTHYLNALEDKKAYSLEFAGETTGFYVSIKDALISDDWDVVTIQQVSHQSPDYQTYQPYLQFMGEYIRKYSPKSKIYIHQTWAYEDGSKRLTEELKYEKASDMLEDIIQAYRLAAEDICADGIIPSGEVMYAMVQHGIEKVHRDTFHATFGLGRYALGLTWYTVLTGNNVEDIAFADLDEETDAEEFRIAKECVAAVTGRK